MAYQDVFVRIEGAVAPETIIFTDLSEKKLHTSFMVPCVDGSNIPCGRDNLNRSSNCGVRNIRTERPHDEGIRDHRRDAYLQLEELLKTWTGPMFDTSGEWGLPANQAIAAASKDVINEVLHTCLEMR